MMLRTSGSEKNIYNSKLNSFSRRFSDNTLVHGSHKNVPLNLIIAKPF